MRCVCHIPGSLRIGVGTRWKNPGEATQWEAWTWQDTSVVIYELRLVS